MFAALSLPDFVSLSPPQSPPKGVASNDEPLIYFDADLEGFILVARRFTPGFYLFPS